MEKKPRTSSRAGGWLWPLRVYVATYTVMSTAFVSRLLLTKDALAPLVHLSLQESEKEAARAGEAGRWAGALATPPRGLRLESQHLRGGSQLPVTPSSDLCGHKVYIQTFIHVI